MSVGSLKLEDKTAICRYDGFRINDVGSLATHIDVIVKMRIDVGSKVNGKVNVLIL